LQAPLCDGVVAGWAGAGAGASAGSVRFAFCGANPSERERGRESLKGPLSCRVLVLSLSCRSEQGSVCIRFNVYRTRRPPLVTTIGGPCPVCAPLCLSALSFCSGWLAKSPSSHRSPSDSSRCGCSLSAAAAVACLHVDGRPSWSIGSGWGMASPM
jgi:hypothetical protein